MRAKSNATEHSPPEVEFLGLRFASVDVATATVAIGRASRGANWSYVVTPNAAHLARLRLSEPDLWSIYMNASHCFLDSRVVALVARLLRLRPPFVVTGSDLVEQLFRNVITPSSSICLIGGDSATAEQVRKSFGLTRLSHVNPSVGFWRDEKQMENLVATIVVSQADYTFLAVGSPQQEILAARVASMGTARGVGMCVGASIEFLTGAQKRAPQFLRYMALEWAYRLACNPKRLARRYAVESPWGLYLVLKEAFHRHIAVRGKG
jgi:N-acetylglucosaminyldiphosphoundecaprenol N-acetyl-beta-D-mannosaminyltransferase